MQIIQKNKKLFITLGIIIAVIPLLSLPSSWKDFIIIILGLWVAIASFLSDKEINMNFGKGKKKTADLKEEKDSDE